MTPMVKTPQEIAATEILQLFLEFQVIMKIAFPDLSGMQEAKYRLLGILEAQGTKSMSDLCGSMFISKSYMSRLVEHLVSEGLVERIVDPSDRRAMNISVTDEGRKELRMLLQNMRNNIIPFISKLSSSDLKRFCDASKEIHTIFSIFTDRYDQSAWSFYTLDKKDSP